MAHKTEEYDVSVAYDHAFGKHRKFDFLFDFFKDPVHLIKRHQDFCRDE